MVNANQESDYEYLKRTIGPVTWIYEILQQGREIKDWDLLEMKIQTCQGDLEKERAVIKSFRFNRFHK